MMRFYYSLLLLFLLLVIINYSGCKLISNPSTTSSTVQSKDTLTVNYSGKVYHTVTIGSQVWLKENLDVGTMVPVGQDQTDNSKIEKYCYDDNADNCTSYGGLYQWAEAMQYMNGAANSSSPNPVFTGNVQGICPNGWHIPSSDELSTLSNAVSDDGNALKAVGEGIYNSNEGINGAGTNTSGFSAILSGFRDYSGYYTDFGTDTYFWSSTENNPTRASNLSLLSTAPNIYLGSQFLKIYGYNVRCIKN